MVKLYYRSSNIEPSLLYNQPHLVLQCVVEFSVSNLFRTFALKLISKLDFKGLCWCWGAMSEVPCSDLSARVLNLH